MARGAAARKRYEEWVREHAADLYRFSRRLSGRADVAEDLVQETFYHAWRSIDQLDAPNNARGWLFGILRNRYAHFVRDSGRRLRNLAPMNAADGSTDGLPDVVESLGQQEILEHALATLEDRYKVPFLMVFMEGLTCQQTSETLEIPLGTVLSRIHRGRMFLRRHLEESGSIQRGALRISGTEPEVAESLTGTDGVS